MKMKFLKTKDMLKDLIAKGRVQCSDFGVSCGDTRGTRPEGCNEFTHCAKKMTQWADEMDKDDQIECLKEKSLQLLKKIEKEYDFNCEAGPLSKCQQFIEVKESLYVA